MPQTSQIYRPNSKKENSPSRNSHNMTMNNTMNTMSNVNTMSNMTNMTNNMPNPSQLNSIKIQTSSTNTHINDSLLNMSSISKPQIPNISSMVNNKKEYCKEHGEELTYYCFDCFCRCICSECVVHGVHKNHEVMNIKRAYPLILEKTDDLLFSVQNKIQDIMNVQQSLDTKRKELVDNTNLIKTEMSQAFEEIKLKLQKKEKEIMDRADVFLQEHLQEMNTYSRVMQSKVISLNKLIDSINSNISRRDEVTMLNFYSESKNRIIQTVDTELPDIPDFDTMYNMKVTINQSSLDTLINSLNTIHFEITSMKGYEVSKVQNSQKYAVKRDMYGSKRVGVNNNLNAGASSYYSGTSSYEYGGMSNNLVGGNHLSGVNTSNNNLVSLYLYLFTIDIL